MLLSVLIVASTIGAITLVVMTAGVLATRCKRLWRRYRTRTHSMWVVRRTDYTDDLFEIELRDKSRPLRRFHPGQFVTVQGPLLPAGVPLERRYSLASWEHKPGSYRLCIKREPQGKMSNWLYQHAKPGATLRLRPPAGEFHLQQCHLLCRDIVLIAAGVGITPLKAMLEWLEHQRYQGRVALFHTARNSAELLYHQQFLALARRWLNFSYRPHLTGVDQLLPGVAASPGRIGADDLFDTGGLVADYYFCASQPMIDSLMVSLQDLGVSPTRMHYELFVVGGGGCGSFEVRCGDKLINAEGFPTLLRVLEVMEIPIDTDCRAGTCGRCLVTLESGALRHTTRLPPDISRNDNQFLSCCAIPEADISIRVGTD